MHKEFIMGNEAIALGAISAGVNLVSGYPGTPSTEVLEACAENKNENMHIEWSVNEKSAMEVAAGASYSGARTLVTMKQVGLNVAADPLMSLEYIGVKGGMVILVADDPGPISSQTEQDTRSFAEFSKVPCFDPSSAQEAYDMIIEAFDISEKYSTPVFFRPTTRVCHGYASVNVKDKSEQMSHIADGFEKNSSRWVIFPRLSFKNHAEIEKRNRELSKEFSKFGRNRIINPSALKKGVVTQGISFTYVEEITKSKPCPALKISTPFPFPEELALEFLRGKDEILCIEELDPYIEKHLLELCGKYQLNVKIRGKLTDDIALSGENSKDSLKTALNIFLGYDPIEDEKSILPDLPSRPPVLCAGCPHRASFYAVKKAMRGKKTVFCGDIGCYTLGNAMPLDMVDTCLCMGAGVNIAQGIWHIDSATSCFAFVGDSTFFASAITGVINAFYNKANMTLVVLDNSTTAMTGHQPHPGTGRTAMGEVTQKVSIENVLRAIGLTFVESVNPLDFEKAVETVKRADEQEGVKAIIFKSPCIALAKQEKYLSVDNDKCVNCKMCIKEIGCPAISVIGDKVTIDKSTCTGCELCSNICPKNAIHGGDIQ